MTQEQMPQPALVVLVGVSGSGKSTWAAGHFAPYEVVSSDQLRAVVGHGEHDQSASADAFAVLDQILGARSRRRLSTVVDSTGLDRKRRQRYLAVARAAALPAVVVILDTDGDTCRSRNAARDRRVPSIVLTAQLVQLPLALGQIEAEGWDAVVRVRQH